MRTIATTLASILLLGMAPAAPAQPAPAAAPKVSASLPAGVERGPSLAGISEYRLGNGLRILLFPDPTQPTITVNVTYLVGSRFEGYGETGMAHSWST